MSGANPYSYPVIPPHISTMTDKSEHKSSTKYSSPSRKIKKSKTGSKTSKKHRSRVKNSISYNKEDIHQLIKESPTKKVNDNFVEVVENSKQGQMLQISDKLYKELKNESKHYNASQILDDSMKELQKEAKSQTRGLDKESKYYYESLTMHHPNEELDEEEKHCHKSKSSHKKSKDCYSFPSQSKTSKKSSTSSLFPIIPQTNIPISEPEKQIRDINYSQGQIKPYQKEINNDYDKETNETKTMPEYRRNIREFLKLWNISETEVTSLLDDKLGRRKIVTESYPIYRSPYPKLTAKPKDRTRKPTPMVPPPYPMGRSNLSSFAPDQSETAVLSTFSPISNYVPLNLSQTPYQTPDKMGELSKSQPPQNFSKGEEMDRMSNFIFSKAPTFKKATNSKKNNNIELSPHSEKHKHFEKSESRKSSPSKNKNLDDIDLSNLRFESFIDYLQSRPEDLLTKIKRMYSEINNDISSGKAYE